MTRDAETVPDIKIAVAIAIHECEFTCTLGSPLCVKTPVVLLICNHCSFTAPACTECEALSLHIAETETDPMQCQACKVVATNWHFIWKFIPIAGAR